jgi:hypothetical protein
MIDAFFYFVVNILIVYFILFFLFWSELKHTKIFRGLRKAIYYLCLDHCWAVFSVPWTENRNLILNVEYVDEKKELISLINCNSKMFFDRKLNTFDEKYIENLTLDIQARTIFINYIKNKIENKNNKKIKKIELVEEVEKIKLWDSNLNANFTEKFTLSSYNF